MLKKYFVGSFMLQEGIMKLFCKSIYLVASILLFLGHVSVSSPVNDDELFLLDTVIAVVYSEDNTFVITKSDLDRPGIDGVYRSLDDRVMEALLYSEAEKYKMIPTKESVDKHLQSVQMENNITKDELYDIFCNAGYTPEEGRDQFSRLSAISSLIDYRIRSRLIIPERDIIKYYEENPVWEEPCYQVQKAVIPVSKKRNIKKLRAELDKLIQRGIGSIRIKWDEPFWMDEDQIAEDWNFIKTMKVNGVRIVRETSDGFELIRLSAKKERRQKPLEERYREIAEILRRPKYDELLKEYKNSLLEAASIVYFEDKETN